MILARKGPAYLYLGPFPKGQSRNPAKRALGNKRSADCGSAKSTDLDVRDCYPTCYDLPKDGQSITGCVTCEGT